MNETTKIVFLSMTLVVCSMVLSMLAGKVKHSDTLFRAQIPSDAIVLDSGTTVEEYINHNEKIWDQKIKELKSENKNIQFNRALIQERKIGMFISWVPWFLASFLFKVKKFHMFFLVGVCCISMLFGFIYWFELPLYLLALFIGNTLRNNRIKN